MIDMLQLAKRKIVEGIETRQEAHLVLPYIESEAVDCPLGMSLRYGANDEFMSEVRCRSGQQRRLAVGFHKMSNAN